MDEKVLYLKRIDNTLGKLWFIPLAQNPFLHFKNLTFEIEETLPPKLK